MLAVHVQPVVQLDLVVLKLDQLVLICFVALVIVILVIVILVKAPAAPTVSIALVVVLAHPGFVNFGEGEQDFAVEVLRHHQQRGDANPVAILEVVPRETSLRVLMVQEVHESLRRRRLRPLVALRDGPCEMQAHGVGQSIHNLLRGLRQSVLGAVFDYQLVGERDPNAALDRTHLMLAVRIEREQ